MKKIHVGILFGGRSAEHEVSIRSAQSVYRAIDKERFAVSLISISKSGFWHILTHEEKTRFSEVRQYLIQDESDSKTHTSNRIHLPTQLEKIDIVFPVLHGPYGEDGTLQGFFKLLNIPCIGAGVLGSAIGMDKDVMKRLMSHASIPVSKFIVIRYNDPIDEQMIINSLGLPLFVKPANLGSSVGVSKVIQKNELRAAISHAFEFDTKVIIEAQIQGRELEISVLGNNALEFSVIGEIIPAHDFYSYEAKYTDEDGAKLIIPAELPESTMQQIKALAEKTFRVLECADFARVDFFLRSDGKVFVNEINTIPGFTNISMYPKLWEASGTPYSQLINRLIDLAMKRFTEQKQIKRLL